LLFEGIEVCSGRTPSGRGKAAIPGHIKISDEPGKMPLACRPPESKGKFNYIWENRVLQKKKSRIDIPLRVKSI
jgi:hypothetical protein